MSTTAVGTMGSQGEPPPPSEFHVSRGVTARLGTPFVGIVVANVVLLLLSVTVLGIDLFSTETLRTFTPILGVMIVATLGQAFVISNGGVDLSLPATITIAGAIVLESPAGENSGLAQAVLICALVALVIGLVNGLLVEVLRFNSLVVTLATGTVIVGITRLYKGEISSATRVPPALADWTTSNVGTVSYVLILALLMCALLALVLRTTPVGRRLLASSSSRPAATLVGLPITLYRLTPWVMAAGFGACAGVLISGQVGTPDMTIGNPYLLATVVAAVLGGIAVTGGPLRPVAAACGALFITILDFDLQARGFSRGVSQVAQGLVLGLGLSLVAWFRASGSIRSIRSRFGGH